MEAASATDVEYLDIDHRFGPLSRRSAIERGMNGRDQSRPIRQHQQHYSRPITTWSGSLGRFTQILIRVINLGTRASSTVSPSAVDTTTARFGVSNKPSNAAKFTGPTSRAEPSVTSVSPS